MSDQVPEESGQDVPPDSVHPSSAQSHPEQAQTSTESGPLSVEDLVESLEAVTRERDDYLDALRRSQADFENYRKAVAKREADARERANEGLVTELLPVLDACDAAVTNGATEVALVQNALVEILAKQGLRRLIPEGEVFDPEQHEAVMHEPADGSGGHGAGEGLRPREEQGVR